MYLYSYERWGERTNKTKAPRNELSLCVRPNQRRNAAAKTIQVQRLTYIYTYIHVQVQRTKANLPPHATKFHSHAVQALTYFLL